MESASDELFARAGRAGDENVGIVPSDLAGDFEDLDDCGAVADDAFVLKILKQLFLEGADLRAASEIFGEFIEGFFESREIQRFAQVIVCAQLDGRDRRFDGIKAGDKDDVNAGVELKGESENGFAIHLRHFQISEDDAAGAKADLLEGIFGICGTGSGEAGPPEAVGGKFDVV